MDAIIFALIFVTLLLLWQGQETLGLILFAVSLVAMLLLFNHHVTSALALGF